MSFPNSAAPATLRGATTGEGNERGHVVDSFVKQHFPMNKPPRPFALPSRTEPSPCFDFPNASVCSKDHRRSGSTLGTRTPRVGLRDELAYLKDNIYS